MGEQNKFILNLDGGLDLTSTFYTNQENVGTASQLINFEPSIEGGYRRINGYTAYGTGSPTGDAHTVLAVFPYADGVVAVVQNGIYFTDDGGNTWDQVNRDTYEVMGGTVSASGTSVTGSGTTFLTDYIPGDHIRINGLIRDITNVNSNTSITLGTSIGTIAGGTAHYKNGTTTLNGTILTRTSQGQSEVAWMEDDGEYGTLVITDRSGNNHAARFQVQGSGGGRTYFYDELTSDSFAAPTYAKHTCIHARRLILANSSTSDSTIYYSERFKTTRFDASSSGEFTLVEPVVAVRNYKDRLIIFCKNSIHQLINIDNTSTVEVQPIATNVGCADGMTIQELGGDIIFLSHDGIRTLSATDQYGDLTLGVISRSIDPIIKSILLNITAYTFSSTVSRYKNQYRLFYTNVGFANGQQEGLIATLRNNKVGRLEWQWSTTLGMPISAVGATTNDFIIGEREEKIYHGGYDGNIYEHDTGDSFNGSPISATITLNEVDYGDIGLRKTLHYVRCMGEAEGDTDDVYMNITYDFGDPLTHQPNDYLIPFETSGIVYGTAIYDTDVYAGLGTRFQKRILVEGSGFSNTFSFNSLGTGSPYSLNSLYVDTRMGAKQ